MQRRVVLAVLILALLLLPGGAGARVFLTQEQAIQKAFPSPQRVERRTLYLSDAQARRVSEAAGVPVENRIVPYYVGRLEGRITGYAYFDTHQVRTLPETILVLLGADARIVRIDILAFDEPEDYLPTGRWLAQFPGRPLDDDLSLGKGIRSLTGATLSARAITEAARRVMALHRLFVAPPGAATPSPAEHRP